MRPPLLALVAAGTIAFSLAAAGCGGSSGAKVAQIATAPTTTTSESSSGGSASKSSDPTAFAACMRKNGVPDFPDPDTSGRLKITGGIRNGQRFGLDPNSAAFQKARKACQKLAPFGKLSPQQQQEAQQAMLRFAQCMRSHGLPKFPDPSFGPGGEMRMTFDKSSGISPNSPTFQAAQKACQGVIPGARFGVGAPPAS